MSYSVRVEQVGRAGASAAGPLLYETETEMEAIALATYEVESNRSDAPRIAIVFDPAGLLLLAYAGGGRAGAERG